MDMFPSHKQVVQEKLVSDPTVPGVQKNEKNENKITVTRNKHEQAEIKCLRGKVESAYQSQKRCKIKQIFSF